MRITINDGAMWFGPAQLGPATALYCYPGEERHLGTMEGVVVRKTPLNIDLVFCVGEKVVGCEVKTPRDLFDSWRSRRLHRQLRTLLTAVDVPGLVVRGWFHNDWPDSPLFWGDISNLQTKGVYLWLVPPKAYMPTLIAYRKALLTDGARILAGRERPPRERQPGWLLRRIPGVGVVKSKQLTDGFGSPLDVLLAAKRGDIAPRFGKHIETQLCRAADS